MGRFGRFSNRWGGAVAGAVAGAFAVDKIVDFGRAMFDLGQDVQVWGIKVDTVFGAQADSVNRWADSVNEAMGLSSERVAGLAANMGDLLVPLGATRKQAADMSQTLVGAAPALAAWSGGLYDAAEVSDIFAKALLGEREQLKSLGISINQAEVDTRALIEAQKDGREEITGMDRAVATQALILEKSTDAQEAWNNGSLDGIKNLNRLKAAWEELKTTVATWLTPKVATGIEELLKLFEPGGTPIFAQGDEFGSLELEGFTEPGAGYAAGQAVLDWWDENASTIEGYFVQFGEWAVEGFEVASEGGDRMVEDFEEIKDVVKELGDWFETELAPALEDFAEVYAPGVEGAVNGVASAFRAAYRAAREFANFVDGISLPFGLGGSPNNTPTVNNPGKGGGRSGGGSAGTGWASGGYVTSPTLGWVAEGGQNEFVFNASQMRGLAAEGISLGRPESTTPTIIVHNHIAGSILAEEDLIEATVAGIRSNRLLLDA